MRAPKLKVYSFLTRAQMQSKLFAKPDFWERQYEHAFGLYDEPPPAPDPPPPPAGKGKAPAKGKGKKAKPAAAAAAAAAPAANADKGKAAPRPAAAAAAAAAAKAGKGRAKPTAAATGAATTPTAAGATPTAKRDNKATSKRKQFFDAPVKKASDRIPSVARGHVQQTTVKYTTKATTATRFSVRDLPLDVAGPLHGLSHMILEKEGNMTAHDHFLDRCIKQGKGGITAAAADAADAADAPAAAKKRAKKSTAAPAADPAAAAAAAANDPAADPAAAADSAAAATTAGPAAVKKKRAKTSASTAAPAADPAAAAAAAAAVAVAEAVIEAKREARRKKKLLKQQQQQHQQQHQQPEQQQEQQQGQPREEGESRKKSLQDELNPIRTRIYQACPAPSQRKRLDKYGRLSLDLYNKIVDFIGKYANPLSLTREVLRTLFCYKDAFKDDPKYLELPSHLRQRVVMDILNALEGQKTRRAPYEKRLKEAIAAKIPSSQLREVVGEPPTFTLKPRLGKDYVLKIDSQYWGLGGRDELLFSSHLICRRVSLPDEFDRMIQIRKTADKYFVHISCSMLVANAPAPTGIASIDPGIRCGLTAFKVADDGSASIHEYCVAGSCRIDKETGNYTNEKAIKAKPEPAAAEPLAPAAANNGGKTAMTSDKRKRKRGKGAEDQAPAAAATAGAEATTPAAAATTTTTGTEAASALAPAAANNGGKTAMTSDKRKRKRGKGAEDQAPSATGAARANAEANAAPTAEAASQRRSSRGGRRTLNYARPDEWEFAKSSASKHGGDEELHVVISAGAAGPAGEAPNVEETIVSVLAAIEDEMEMEFFSDDDQDLYKDCCSGGGGGGGGGDGDGHGDGDGGDGGGDGGGDHDDRHDDDEETEAMRVKEDIAAKNRANRLLLPPVLRAEGPKPVALNPVKTQTLAEFRAKAPALEELWAKKEKVSLLKKVKHEKRVRSDQHIAALAARDAAHEKSLDSTKGKISLGVDYFWEQRCHRAKVRHERKALEAQLEELERQLKPQQPQLHPQQESSQPLQQPPQQQPQPSSQQQPELQHAQQQQQHHQQATAWRMACREGAPPPRKMMRSLRRQIKALLAKERRIGDRIKNYRNEVHKNAALEMMDVEVILIPALSAKELVANESSVLDRKTKWKLLCLAHSKFRKLLRDKAELYPGVAVVLCTEEYTSKSCGGCGKVNWALGSKKTFVCPDEACGYIADRDHSASRNILLLRLKKTGALSHLTCPRGAESPRLIVKD